MGRKRSTPKGTFDKAVRGVETRAKLPPRRKYDQVKSFSALPSARRDIGRVVTRGWSMRAASRWIGHLAI